ncbi:MAG: hypothetical protein AAF742_09035, partial [Pseudomonadota bacterium]
GGSSPSSKQPDKLPARTPYERYLGAQHAAMESGQKLTADINALRNQHVDTCKEVAEEHAASGRDFIDEARSVALEKVENSREAMRGTGGELRRLQVEHNDFGRTIKTPDVETAALIVGGFSLFSMIVNLMNMVSGDASMKESIIYAVLGEIALTFTALYIGWYCIRGGIDYKKKVYPENLTPGDRRKRRNGLFGVFGLGTMGVSIALILVRLRTAPDPESFLDFDDRTGVTLAETFANGPSLLMIAVMLLSTLVTIKTAASGFADPVPGASALKKKIDQRAAEAVAGVERFWSGKDGVVEARIKAQGEYRTRGLDAIKARNEQVNALANAEGERNGSIDVAVMHIENDRRNAERDAAIITNGTHEPLRSFDPRDLNDLKIFEITNNGDAYRIPLDEAPAADLAQMLQSKWQEATLDVERSVQELKDFVETLSCPDLAGTSHYQAGE